MSGKSMATAAEDYLKDLVGRNLVFVHQLGLTGNIKSCKIHDLLRELCLREAEKERFYNIIQPDMHSKQRFVNPKSISDDKILNVLQYSPRARSLILTCDCEEVRLRPDYGMLRMLNALGMVVYANQSYETFLEDVFQLVKLRYLAAGLEWDSKFPSSITLLWNLQIFVVDNQDKLTAPAEIWTMPQLRHVYIIIRGVHLPDPPCGLNDTVVMENLQTLETVLELKCSKEVVKRIPNVKKLRIIYDGIERNGDYYCLSNLEGLCKLESLWCWNDTRSHDHLQNLTFPHSLKKLCLMLSDFVCEDMLEKIGLLPLLQKLKLIGGFFRTRKWETVEGQFPRLEYLSLEWCTDLECWETDISHFPRLEHLVLSGLQVLEKIPSEIGELPTLKSIELIACSKLAVESAKVIVLEQEEIQGEQLSFHVRVVIKEKNEALQSLAARNFEVDLDE